MPSLSPSPVLIFFLTSGGLWRRKLRKASPEVLEEGPSCSRSAPSRHVALPPPPSNTSSCSGLVPAEPAAAASMRAWRDFVGCHHPRRRRQGAPTACKPRGGFKTGASGRRGCGEGWRRRRYAKCESAWGSPECCRRKPPFPEPRPRLEGVQT